MPGELLPTFEIRSTSASEGTFAPALCACSYTGNNARRRFLFEKQSDSCSSSNSHEAWFMVLDRDHTNCANTETGTYPRFLYRLEGARE